MVLSSLLSRTRRKSSSLTKHPVGHSIGYIKVWLLSNYMLPNPPKVCVPLLTLKFPFLWKDKTDGGAKRAVRNQPLPLLPSSVRGHMQGISCLQVISSAQIILGGSADHTVRLWSFGGRYLSTLGTFRDWVPILPTIPVEKYFDDIGASWWHETSTN
ncbi:hypothetical protein DMN91_010958 [Ooceraea biroi]|uniref:WD repeat-containing protein on Y chromosome n=1 Tax=Ooceraea biroi TaxID=2015173 RepID=A0A3L8DAJ8_OOCBI|nr:WD repeat-containing protein on Y chromosome [Ooceraea biroi]RLU16889.1 hypothetical protein DMN91_010958 [Ooceraea biroi]